METLNDFDDDQGKIQDVQMDKAERQKSEQWRDEEINTRIRRKDNTIEQGD